MDFRLSPLEVTSRLDYTPNNILPSRATSNGNRQGEIRFKLAEIDTIFVYWATWTEIFAEIPLNDL